MVSSTALVNENSLDSCCVLVTGVSQSMLFSRRLHIRRVNFHVYRETPAAPGACSEELDFASSK